MWQLTGQLATMSLLLSSPILGARAEGRGGEDSNGKYFEWQSIDQFGRTTAATSDPDSEHIPGQEKVS